MEFKNAPSEVNIEEGLRQQEYIIKLKQLIAEKTHQMGRKPTCCVTTFGCQMNAKDSEKLVGILKEAGYEIIDSEDADFVIFNPDETFVVGNYASKSRNSPFTGETLWGKIYYTICGGKIVYEA